MYLTNCNRWEIGEKPQLVAGVVAGVVDCNRWEIGEKPQPVAARQTPEPEIVTDGRSGRNRNVCDGAYGDRAIVTDGRSGRNRNGKPYEAVKVEL